VAKQVLVLGGGIVGTAMALDMRGVPDVAVTVVEARPEVAERLGRRLGIATRVVDLTDTALVRSLCEEFHLVLGALPSAIGLQTLRAVLGIPRNYCDVSFMPEDARTLSGLAVSQEVTAIVDAGVAPGLSNLMAGWAATRLERFDRLAIYVGGIPAQRQLPFEYKAGFAPLDVIEEYTRPSRVVESGRVVIKEPLSDVELLDFPGVGTLEAFITDGLRSLAEAIDAPEMIEKTLRYPGHAAQMSAFREAGLFSKEPVRVGDAMVRPLDFTASLLFPKWTYAEGEADLTVMRVVAEGVAEGRRTRFTWELLDRYDAASGLRSMSRCTAFVGTAVARRLLTGDFRGQWGVFAPETLGRRPGFLHGILADLEARGIRVGFREESI
jgi:lysine 6-dehydrogenase